MAQGYMTRAAATADPWGDTSPANIGVQDANVKAFIAHLGESVRAGMAPPGYDEADAGLMVQSMSTVSNRRRTLAPTAALVVNLVAVAGGADIIALLDAVLLPAAPLTIFSNNQVAVAAAIRAAYEGMIFTGVGLDLQANVVNTTTGDVFDDYNKFLANVIAQRYSLRILPGVDPDNSLVFDTPWRNFLTPDPQFDRARTIPAIEWGNQEARMEIQPSPASITGAPYLATAPGLVGDALNVEVVARFFARTVSPNIWSGPTVNGLYAG